VPSRYLSCLFAEKFFQFPDLMEGFELAAFPVKIGTCEPE